MTNRQERAAPDGALPPAARSGRNLDRSPAGMALSVVADSALFLDAR